MSGAIGEILPLALGIAISPIPIIAAILMLLSPNARGTSVGFLLGWCTGIAVVVVAFSAVATVLPDEGTEGPRPIVGIIKVVLGALLLLLALKQWRSRPMDGEEPKLPKWMAAIDTITSGKALVLGSLLSGLNPKNLLLGLAGGLVIESAGLTLGGSAVVIAVFTLIAAASVAAPVLAYLIASDRMAGRLEALRHWLVQNNATVMTVLLLVMGVMVIGKGIGSFV